MTSDHAVDIDKHVDLHHRLRRAPGADDRHGGDLRFHLPVHQAVTIALIVATIKGSLVACYFMHLISGKKQSTRSSR
jgi:hypothetical protein